MRLRAADPRAEPRIRDRVPFLVRDGPANSRLIDLTVTPEEMLAEETHKLNVNYYIHKRLVPTLNRCLAVFGATDHCRQWLAQLPKYNRIETESAAGRGQTKGLIHHHFSSTACLVCEVDIARPDQHQPRLCAGCLRTPVLTSATLAARLSKLESLRARLHRICKVCTQSPGTEVDCVAVSCPVTFEREKIGRQMASEKFHDMRKAAKFASQDDDW